jgi:hypothetical protein
VTGKTTRRFREAFEALPEEIRANAREKYQLWKREPFHPSLQFKELAPGLWSVRIGIGYGALARRNDELVA